MKGNKIVKEIVSLSLFVVLIPYISIILKSIFTLGNIIGEYARLMWN